MNISCKYKNTTGVLATENNSIIFIRKDGFLSKKQRVIVSIPYDAIRTINIEGTFSKKLVISVDKSKVKGIPRHEFKVSNPHYVMDIIQNEINKDEQQSQHPKEILKEVHVKEVVVKVPCGHCGTLNENTQKSCYSCGAPLGS